VPGFAQDRKEIGQVVLPLGVGAARAAQRPPQQREVGAVEPGIDLVDGLLRGGGVAILHDPLESAGAVAHHAAIAGGIGHARGEHRGGGAAGTVAAHQGAQRGGPDERDIAVEDEQVATLAAEQQPGLQDGVGGAELLLLPHQHRLVGGQRGGHLLGLVAHHGRQGRGAQRRGRTGHMADHGGAAQHVQQLDALRAHALALASGQQERVEGPFARGSSRHQPALRSRAARPPAFRKERMFRASLSA
jgi:hypothetical protein